MATYAELDIIHAMANKVSIEITEQELSFANDINILNELNEQYNKLSKIRASVAEKLEEVSFDETMSELKNLQDQVLLLG